MKPFDDYRCIFVHIPKCGGMSVCKSLFGNLGGGHLSIKQYQTIFSKREFANYFKFTFVRNPWDRLVSAFFFLKEGGANEWDRKWAAEHLSAYTDFDCFVKRFVDRKSVKSSFHFAPQHSYISGANGRPLVDFVGFFENIQEDYCYIQKRIGAGTSLEHYNKTKSRKPDYQQYYTEETHRIIAEVYREDIQLLGYEFDNSSLQRQLERRGRQ